MPIGRPQPSDDLAISQRLVGLLPIHGHAAAPPANAKNKNYIPAVMVFACLALAAALLFGVL
ncbi:MAG: hypothetical protein WA709_05320 [Stellaceae bacterium]